MMRIVLKRLARRLGTIRYFVFANMSVKKVIFGRVFISDPFSVAESDIRVLCPFTGRVQQILGIVLAAIVNRDFHSTLKNVKAV